jgi:hypothetical protein
VDSFNQEKRKQEVMYQSDTTANSLVVVSGTSAMIHFATTWLPVFSMCAAFIAIISGTLAAIYYIKKIKEK